MQHRLGDCGLSPQWQNAESIKKASILPTPEQVNYHRIEEHEKCTCSAKASGAFLKLTY